MTTLGYRQASKITKTASGSNTRRTRICVSLGKGGHEKIVALDDGSADTVCNADGIVVEEVEIQKKVKCCRG